MARYDNIYKEVLDIDKKCISDLYDSLDMSVMDQIVDLLCTIKKNHRKIITAGCGTSGMAAQILAHMLNVIEVPAHFLAPGNSIHGGMGAIQKDDVVILLTKGGTTKEILNYIPVCKAKGATIIGVTEIPNSPLAKNCDIMLKVAVEKESDPWGLIASGSIIAVLAAWHAIIFAAMQHNGVTMEDYYLIHPGGSSGEKLEALLR